MSAALVFTLRRALQTILILFLFSTIIQCTLYTAQRDSYFRTPFLLYFAALTLWMLLMFYWMLSRSVSPTLRRFAWGVSSGSITGLQNFLKDSSTLLKAERPPGQGLPWYLPLFAILAIVSAFSGLLLLTACMKRYDATYSSAMFVGSFVVSASIMSACHYSTFQHLETLWNQILYPAGLLILMGGVLLLVKEKKESSDGDDNDDNEDDITGISTPEERSESETRTRHHELVRTSKVMPIVSNFVSDDPVSCISMHILVFCFAM